MHDRCKKLSFAILKLGCRLLPVLLSDQCHVKQFLLTVGGIVISLYDECFVRVVSRKQRKCFVEHL